LVFHDLPRNIAYSERREDIKETRVRQTTIIRVIRLWFLTLLVLYGCATPEVLMPKSATAPAGVDFSGKWKIRPESTLDQGRINAAIDRTDGVDNKTVMREMIKQQRSARNGMRRSGKNSGGLVHLFLETGDLLKITQTPYTLFISFDRAVVEEYSFGENRPINIGGADAHRVSGWEGSAYVIETLGEKGMKLTDRYSLADDNERLIRHITLRSKKMEEVTIVQELDRQSD
jgi:hypothetical protein